MIDIKEKKDCCGCTACVQKCPKQCISLIEDNQGFLYPIVNEQICVDCGLCEKVCSAINQNEGRKPIKVYAAKNPNEEIKMKSSSGGIFTMLAEKIISNGGVVFGARFNDNWEVIHDYTETTEGIAAFRGSKYVQSRIENNYKKAETFLKEGREVLFTGTPCQIAGLYKFLMKDYENLITVDVVCHGVPSPLVWRDYLKYIIARKGEIGKNTVLSSLKDISDLSDISFRDKSTGWKKFGFVVRRWSVCKADQNSVLPSDKCHEDIILHETLDKNVFMQGFLKNLYLRPSCYDCPSKCGKSKSDITIGDYWGIPNHYPQIDDNKGVGLVLLNSEKGTTIYNKLYVDNLGTTYQQALQGNPSIEKSVVIPKLRNKFWIEYQRNGINAIEKTCKKMKPTLFSRIISKLNCIISKK